MHGLRDALEQSERDKAAIGHFNVSDWVLLKAVLSFEEYRSCILRFPLTW
jgi:hypothetical protein